MVKTKKSVTVKPHLRRVRTKKGLKIKPIGRYKSVRNGREIIKHIKPIDFDVKPVGGLKEYDFTSKSELVEYAFVEANSAEEARRIALDDESLFYNTGDWENLEWSVRLRK